jgi:hypothetical protein
MAKYFSTVTTSCGCSALTLYSGQTCDSSAVCGGNTNPNHDLNPNLNTNPNPNLITNPNPNTNQKGQKGPLRTVPELHLAMHISIHVGFVQGVSQRELPPQSVTLLQLLA